MKNLFILIAMLVVASVNAQTGQPRFEAANVVVDVEKTIDSLYYSTVLHVFVADKKGTIPTFVKDTNVVSNNNQTGFQVDAQRLQAVEELMGRVND